MKQFLQRTSWKSRRCGTCQALQLEGEIRSLRLHFPQKQGNAGDVRLTLRQSGITRKDAEGIDLFAITLSNRLGPREHDNEDFGLRPSRAKSRQRRHCAEKIAQLERAGRPHVEVAIASNR